MSNWSDTPFKDLTGAHETVTGMGLNPTEITLSDDGALYFFIIYEGRDTVYVAQDLTGSVGGPVREKVITSKQRVRDPRIPTFKEEDRLLAGPWLTAEQKTLEAVEAHWQKQYVNFDNVEVLHIILYRIGDDEYEYLESGSDILTRVLHRRK